MIPISQPDLGALERQYLLDAYDSGWVSSLGAYIEKAESLLRDATGATHAAVCNNGTTALHLALLAAGVGPGDEVILPSLTYIATINAIYYVGATPVIVDVYDDTWCIDIESAREAITDRTKAIIAVDLYGQPANYPALRELATPTGITIIADAAESLGASLEGVATGKLADISTFSFFGNKTITSGEGGAVTAESESMMAAIRQLRNQGNHPTQRYFHEVVGYNYRMTNLSAAILTAQLERRDELIGKRRGVVAAYDARLTDAAGIRLQSLLTGAVQSPWMFSVRLTGFTAQQRDQVASLLRQAGVETRPVFLPVQAMPFVAPPAHPTVCAERISDEGLSLPTFPGLQESQIDEIVTALAAARAQVLSD